MRPTQLLRFLTETLPTARKPYFIWGPPGIGKSDVVRQAAEALGWQLYDFRAYLHEPTDLIGVPSVVDGQTHTNPPAWLPSKGKGIFLLDELANALPAMQNVCLQLIHDRRVGEYELPRDWVCVAISNRVEDRAGSRQISTSVANRFATHIDYEVNHDDWHDWAVRNDVYLPIRSYLSFVPGALMEFDPTKNPRVFPSARSWTNLGHTLQHTPRDLHLEVAKGAVGEGRAIEFIAHSDIFEQLPKPADVLAKAKTHELPTDPSVVYALVNAIVEHLRQSQKRGDDLTKISQQIATVALRYATGKTVDSKTRKEQSMLLMRDSTVLETGVLTNDTGMEWAKANPEMADALEL